MFEKEKEKTSMYAFILAPISNMFYYLFSYVHEFTYCIFCGDVTRRCNDLGSF